jgi:hypothetical protein
MQEASALAHATDARRGCLSFAGCGVVIPDLPRFLSFGNVAAIVSPEIRAQIQSVYGGVARYYSSLSCFAALQLLQRS